MRRSVHGRNGKCGREVLVSYLQSFIIPRIEFATLSIISINNICDISQKHDIQPTRTAKTDVFSHKFNIKPDIPSFSGPRPSQPTATSRRYLSMFDKFPAA
jgi:hypothetical protein